MTKTNDKSRAGKTAPLRAARVQLESLEEIEKLGREYFASEFPNATRTDCPPRARLRESASSGSLPDDDLLAHLFSCSDCFREFREAVSATASVPKPWWRRLFSTSDGFLRPALATLALVVAFAVVAGFLLRNRSEQTRTSTEVNTSDQTRRSPAEPDRTPRASEAPATASSTQALGTATTRIDLRDYVALGSVERDGATAREGSKSIRVVAARTSLDLRLPEGSTSGVYTISVLSRATLKPLISAKGNSATGKSLEATLDLDSLAPQGYVLRIARPGEAPSDYSLVVYRK